MNDKWGYINPDGRFVIPARYRSAEPFSEGYAAIATGDEFRNISFIDHTGEVIITGLFSEVKPFRHGLAFFCDEVTIGYIDETDDCPWRCWNVPHK